MKYFRLKTLLTFLLLNCVTFILNYLWTSDHAWISFIMVFYLGFSVLFWLIISLISLIKRARLKKELFYFIGLGLWNIIMTIEYFKHIVFENSLSDFVFFSPYAIIVLICLLPIPQIWNCKN